MKATDERLRECPRCEGKGWYWRTPDGFNSFLAGGFATARAMYKVECSHGPALVCGTVSAIVGGAREGGGL